MRFALAFSGSCSNCAAKRARTLPGILLLAAGMGALCAWLGLSLSWAISLPAGPAIVLTASALFFVSLFFGTRSRLLVGWRTLMG